jgi:hypothetical protein
MSVHRLSLTPQGNSRYELKTPYRNGTTHMIFESLDFISKLVAGAALVFGLLPSNFIDLCRISLA